MNFNLKKINEDNFLESLLINRGIKKEDFFNFLNPSKNNEFSPFLLNNIQNGIDLIKKNINKSIFIVIDSDCDGITSAAEIYLYLKKLNPNANISWAMHEEKHHGILLEEIPENTNLIIVPDASSNESKIHQELLEMGIDICVIDHHLSTKEELLNSPAIIINNQMDDYPNKTLSGAGVALKFLQACDKEFNVNYSQDLYDLAAIGCIGDSMLLNNLETRYIVDNGLNNIHNEGIKFIIKSLGIENLTPTSVAFYIAPLFNAIIRIGSLEEKELLFKGLISPLEDIKSKKRGHQGEIVPLITEVIRIANNCKNKQKKITDKGLELIEYKIKKEDLNINKILFILLDDYEAEFIPGSITGLIAMKLSNIYNKPVLIGRLDNYDLCKGSGRGILNSSFSNLKKFLDDTGLFEYVQGHAEAHGFCIKKKNIEKFLNIANKKLENYNFEDKHYFIDYLFDENNINKIIDFAPFVEDYNFLWGKGIEEPSFGLSLSLNKNQINFIGENKNTIKINYKDNINLIKFKDDILTNLIINSSDNFKLNCVGKIRINKWMDNISYQFIIEDYEIKKNRRPF